jgi:MFS family permease
MLLRDRPFLISLMSTVASLPFFLFTLPAGALADKVDRQKLISFINVGLAAMAAGLAVLGWLHLINPYLILVSVFLIGIGFAFNAQPGHRLCLKSSQTPSCPLQRP